MTKLGTILKSRDITLLTKFCLVKGMIFPVVMYGCELDHKEDWALENGCFLIVVLEKTLENSLDCKEIKSVNPKGNQPWIFLRRMDAEAETPIGADSLEKTLMLGKIEGKKRRGRQRMRWIDSIIDSMDMNLSKVREMVKDSSPWGHSQTRLSDWTGLSFLGCKIELLY